MQLISASRYERSSREILSLREEKFYAMVPKHLNNRCEIPELGLGDSRQQMLQLHALEPLPSLCRRALIDAVANTSNLFGIVDTFAILMKYEVYDRRTRCFHRKDSRSDPRTTICRRITDTSARAAFGRDSIYYLRNSCLTLKLASLTPGNSIC